MVGAHGDQALFSAIQANDAEAVAMALRQGAGANATVDGDTPFHACVKLGDALDHGILDALLSAGGDINRPDAAGRTPLDAALAFEVEKNTQRYDFEKEEWKPHTEMAVWPPVNTLIALYERDAKATDHDFRIGEIRDAMLDKEATPMRHWNLKSHLRVMTSTFSEKGLEGRLPQQVRRSDVLIQGPNGTSYYDVPFVPLPAPEHGKDDPYLPFIKCMNHAGKVAHATGQFNDLEIWHGFMETMSADWQASARDLPQADGWNLYEKFEPIQIILNTIALHDVVRTLPADVLREVSERDIQNYIQDSLNQHLPRLCFDGRTPAEAIALAETVGKHYDALEEMLSKQREVSPPKEYATFAEEYAGFTQQQMAAGAHQKLFDLLTGHDVESPLHGVAGDPSILSDKYAQMSSVDQVMEACGFRDHLRQKVAWARDARLQQDIKRAGPGEIVPLPDVSEEVEEARKAEAQKEAERATGLQPLHKHRLSPMTETEVEAWASKGASGELDAAIADLTADYYAGKVAALKAQGKTYAADKTLNRVIEERQAAKGYRDRIRDERAGADQGDSPQR